jgi:hypothetical protein
MRTQVHITLSICTYVFTAHSADQIPRAFLAFADASPITGGPWPGSRTSNSRPRSLLRLSFALELSQS